MAEDILDVLRDCVQNHRQMDEVNGKVCLGGRYFPKNVETTFPIKPQKGNQKVSPSRKFYNLGEILYFVENHTLSHIEYTRRAQERNIRCVLRPDRKRLLLRIFGGLNLKTRSASEKQSNAKPEDLRSRITQHDLSLQNRQTVAKKTEMDRNGEKQKPHVRTYSRKRSHESRRQSMVNEDEAVDMDLSSLDSNISEELALLKNENLIMEGTVKSMSSFLKDHLGVTADQIEIIQNGESNTVELSNIATEIKNNVVHASVLSLSNTSSRMNFNTTRQCYKAVKHPVRGWEMTKQELASVLLGDEPITKLEEQKSASIEDYVSKGSLLLKRAFSVLISQMREYNKPLKATDGSDTFCRKVVKDCLTDAVDGFRDLFNELLSSKEIDNESGAVEKWVDVSRAELGKLFHSLVMTLESLRDIATSQQKPPISLFHLPEPTFSLALNPSKVTHSVVLEMYVRIGLAELRQILMFILGCGPNTLKTDLVSDVSNVKSNSNHVAMKGSLDQERVNASHLHHNLLQPDTEQIGDENPSSPSSLSSRTEHSPVFDGALFHGNGESLSLMNRKSTYQTRRSSGSDYCQYNMFKASIGNTLVSSFKKQIQEKIQASQFLP